MVGVRCGPDPPNGRACDAQRIGAQERGAPCDAPAAPQSLVVHRSKKVVDTVRTDGHNVSIASIDAAGASRFYRGKGSSMKSLFHRIANPWTVSVEWGGRTITHRAATFSDATDWMRQYPADAFAVVSHRVRGVVSARIA